jgi:hypothetical protein
VLVYIAGIFSSVVGFLGLVALFFYAYDTRKMRLAVQQQLESAITPRVLQLSM